MRLLVEALAAGPLSGDPLDVLVIATLRVTLVLIVAICLGMALGRASAAVRHRAYSLALVATVVVPVVWAIAPAIPIGVIEGVDAEPPADPVATTALETTTSRTSTIVDGTEFRRMLTAPRAIPQRAPTPSHENTEAGVQLFEPAGAPVVGPSELARGTNANASIPWPSVRTLILAGWVTGLFASLLYLTLGIAGALRLIGKTTPVRDMVWLGELYALSRWLGIRRPVVLLEAQRAMSPVAWGWLRPRIVLPAGSDAWSPARRRSVLLHELAHVKRGDWLWQMSSNLITALWWFHPLVWYVAVRMRNTSEQAADDIVVTHGQPPARYAEELLSIATGLAHTRWPGPAQAMFRSSRLETRLKAILDPRRRRKSVTRRLSWATLVVAVAVIVPLATLAPSEIQAEAPADAPTSNHATTVAEAKETDPKPTDTVVSGKIEGIVRQLDGAPAEGAKVVLIAKSGRYTNVFNGILPESSNTPSTLTAADGKYAFDRPSEAFLLVALHDRGYAEVLFDATDSVGDLQLKGWGRIEGTLYVGDRRLADAPIRYRSMTTPKIGGNTLLNHNVTTTTDGQGHFVAERVSPGQGLIGHMYVQSLTIPNGKMTSSSPLWSTSIQVEPGATTHVTLGGSGRPLVGRAVAKKPDGTVLAWAEYNVPGTAYWLGDSGELRRFALPIAKDGTFRGVDLPAGKYLLHVMLKPRVIDGDRVSFPVIGQGKKRFTIPEIPGGRSAEPFDVGEVEIELSKDVLIGGGAPDTNSQNSSDRLNERYAGFVSELKLFGGVPNPDDSAAPKPPVAAALPDSAAPMRMIVRTVSKETGKPIADVPVRIRMYYRGAKTKYTLPISDADGRLSIEYPPEPRLRSIRMDGRSQGMVPYHVNWGGQHSELELPDEYVMRFEPATTIGGTIRDASGMPVKDAPLKITYPATDSNQSNYNYYLARNLKTDAEGRWQCHTVPVDFSETNIRVEHPDFLSMSVDVRAGASSLRDKSHVLVLRTGPTLAGHVTDGAGRAIAGASVLLGSSTYDSNKQTATSDEDGNFQLDNCKQGTQFLCVVAEGHAPDLRRVTVGLDNAPVAIQLEPAATFRLRIVDEQGEPVAGTEPIPAWWRGQQMLKLRRKVDEDGRWVWNGAPHDVVNFSILAGNANLTMRNVPLTASSDEQIVTVHPKFSMRGRVVDAESGQPIDQFHLYSASQVTPTLRWDKYHDVPGRNGQYTFQFEELRSGYALRVEADGYRPAESPTFTAAKHPPTIDFKLHKQGTIAGRVEQPDGRPAAGATVVLVRTSDPQWTQIRNGRFRDNPEYTSVKTGADGRYSFSKPQEPYQLVALHDTGYLDVRCNASADALDLKLQPWGRIEGTLKVGTQPGKEKPIRFSPKSVELSRTSRLSHDYTTETDSEGRFVIERVIPGQGSISNMLITSHVNSWTHSPLRSVPIEIKPGETAHVTLGGTGRPVIGRAVAKKRDGSMYTWEDNNPPSAFTKDDSKLTQFFHFPIDKDGTFRGDDLPAGDYTLSVRLTPPVLDNRCGFGNAIGSGSLKFTIPAMPTGRSDEPLDVGEIEVKLFKMIEAGDAAPDFALETLDGKPVALAEHRGKVVLLDFWATWCGPCLAEMPNMRSVHEAFGDDPNFAMLAISIDQNAKAPRDKAATDGYRWPQLWAGSGGWQATVAQDYGVRAIPATFLIGPDGTVINKGLRGEALRSAVKAALVELGK